MKREYEEVIVDWWLQNFKAPQGPKLKMINFSAITVKKSIFKFYFPIQLFSSDKKGISLCCAVPRQLPVLTATFVRSMLTQTIRMRRQVFDSKASEIGRSWREQTLRAELVDVQPREVGWDAGERRESRKEGRVHSERWSRGPLNELLN